MEVFVRSILPYDFLNCCSNGNEYNSTQLTKALYQCSIARFSFCTRSRPWYPCVTFGNDRVTSCVHRNVCLGIAWKVPADMVQPQ